MRGSAYKAVVSMGKIVIFSSSTLVIQIKIVTLQTMLASFPIGQMERYHSIGNINV